MRSMMQLKSQCQLKRSQLSRLVLGIVMIFSPNISVAAVAYIVGTYLVLFGIDCIILAFSRIGEGKQY